MCTLELLDGFDFLFLFLVFDNIIHFSAKRGDLTQRVVNNCSIVDHILLDLDELLVESVNGSRYV